MVDYLNAEALMKHVRALADDIGARPAGTPREARAHHYVSQTLAEANLTDIETLDFKAPDTWGYSTIIPTTLALAGNALLGGRRGRFLGGLVSLYAAYTLWKTMGAQRTLLASLAPSGISSTQVVRIPAKKEARHKLVFIGHVDANRDRKTFTTPSKYLLQAGGTVQILATALNGLALLARALGSKKALPGAYRLSLMGLLTAFLVHMADEQGEFIDGANDNASAVACLLGLAAHFKANPLDNTEVWLAFTGAEEVGCLGTHALLDAHGEALQNAYFLDFEMVGAGDLAYVTHHSSFSHFTGYTPDPQSAALVAETARKHPDFRVTGRPMTMLEEVAVLRSRGYRGLCLVGVGEDGYLVNWHQSTDVSANIEPAKLERAAKFALAYAQTLDKQ